MPPIPARSGPLATQRVVLYVQTYHHPNGEYHSLLPLLEKQCGVTHIILAAIHVNDGPHSLTLNDDPPSHEKFTQLWDEVLVLQDNGIKVLGMLGGAAKGSFVRLDTGEHATGSPVLFEEHYIPLRDMIRRYQLNGIDLDVEEEMTLGGIVHLISRLRLDFGPDFIITLAPVATALMEGRPHLSGFNYKWLEAVQGSNIAWYNTQFYNGWGGINHTAAYEEIMQNQWPPEKVVVGMLTNPRHGPSGYVPLDLTSAVLSVLLEKYPRFGGVMGWEYWQSLPDENESWKWACCMSLIFLMKRVRDAALIHAMARGLSSITMNR